MAISYLTRLSHIEYRVNKKKHALARNYILVVHVLQDESKFLIEIILMLAISRLAARTPLGSSSAFL